MLPPMVAPWSWTGFYIGGNVGYSWGNSDDSDITLTNTGGATLFTTPGSFNMNGAIAGGQIGYNWQANNWVLGAEADFQWSGQDGSTDFLCPTGVCTPPFGVIALFPGPPIAGSLDQKLKWFGTVRGRAGFLVTPSVLLYGTGGLAFGEIDTDLTVSTPLISNSFSNSTTRVGWTAGAGIEGRIAGQWTAKLEYLYMDLGTFSDRFVTTIPAFGGGFVNVNYNRRFTDNIVRLGVNYHF